MGGKGREEKEERVEVREDIFGKKWRKERGKRERNIRGGGRYMGKR